MFKVISNAYAAGEDRLEALLFGDWLTNVKAGTDNWVLPIWIREVFFESIREAEFPGHASRCNSSFLWPSAEEATKHRSLNDTKGGHVYECQAEREQTRVDVALWDRGGAVDVARPLAPWFAQLLEDARRYYAGEASDDPVWEILADEPVTVVRKVES